MNFVLDIISCATGWLLHHLEHNATAADWPEVFHNRFWTIHTYRCCTLLLFRPAKIAWNSLPARPAITCASNLVMTRSISPGRQTCFCSDLGGLRYLSFATKRSTMTCVEVSRSKALDFLVNLKDATKVPDRGALSSGHHWRRGPQPLMNWYHSSVRLLTTHSQVAFHLM